MDYLEQRNEIIEIGKRLYAKNFVASNDGNISLRISENLIIVTPSGVSKGYMVPDDMVLVDLEGKVVSGSKVPSSELKMHLAVFQNRNDVKAIVHAHPQKTTAFAVARIPIDKIALPEVIFSLGMISVAEYATPTTSELPAKVAEKIRSVDALILENHGALTVGKDLMDAYYKMETLEQVCAIKLYAHQLGGEKFLDDAEVGRLFDIRKEVYGKNMPGCKGCGYCDSIKGNKKGSYTAPLDNIPDAGILKEDLKKQSIKEIIRQIIAENSQPRV